MVRLCEDLNLSLIAEGIETVEEYEAVRECGIALMQGYLFARPEFEALPAFQIPAQLSPAAPPKVPNAVTFPMLPPAMTQMSPERELAIL